MRLPLCVILVLGAALRLGLWFSFQGLPLEIDDEQHYNILAKNLVEHGEFSFRPGTLTSLRPPLYPALVAVVYEMCGLENYQAVRLLQAVFSLLNVLVLYGLGKEVAGNRAALWVAGLFCFYPSFLGINNLLLTETLFTLLLCTFCYLFVLAYRRQQLRYLLAAGLILGLATLTRSILWLSPPLLAVFLLATWNATVLRRVVAVLALLVPFAATLAPWAIRCSKLEHTFVAVDTMGGRNFMMGNYRHTPLYRSWDAISITGENAWQEEVIATYPPEERRTQGKLDKLALKQGLLFVREHPWLTIQRDIIKFFDFWGLERELVAGASRGYCGPISASGLALLVLIIFGFYAVTLFLGIFGLMMAPLTDWRLHLFLALVVAYVCGIHTLVFAHSRYHLPIMPLVLVFAASAIAAGPTVILQWRRGRFWLAMGLCALIALGWIWNIAAGDLDRFQQSIYLGV